MTFGMAGCASPFTNDKGGDKSETKDAVGMMDEPDGACVTTEKAAHSEKEGKNGAAGRKGSEENDPSEGFELTGDVVYIGEY